MDLPDTSFVRDQEPLKPTPPMRLEGQSGPRPTGQSLRQFVTPLELDDDVGKIMLPASPGMAPPQLQEAPDLRHIDNPSTVTTSSAVLLQCYIAK